MYFHDEHGKFNFLGTLIFAFAFFLIFENSRFGKKTWLLDDLELVDGCRLPRCVTFPSQLAAYHLYDFFVRCAGIFFILFCLPSGFRRRLFASDLQYLYLSLFY